MKRSVFRVLAAALAVWTSAAFAEEDPAQDEMEKALALRPNPVNGRGVFEVCSLCHLPEAWGREDGSIPMLAGQHYPVLIKQLADIRAKKRDTPTMLPYANPETIGGAQAVADVAAYVAELPMNPQPGVGAGNALRKGEKLYKKHCLKCHGEDGQGDAERFIPRIGGQHYLYLVRQFRWIRDGKRRNGDPEMIAQSKDLNGIEVEAIMDYASRLKPPEALLAPPGWKNMDLRR